MHDVDRPVADVGHVDLNLKSKCLTFNVYPRSNVGRQLTCLHRRLLIAIAVLALRLSSACEEGWNRIVCMCSLWDGMLYLRNENKASNG